jgi:hypothetical protein
MKDNLVERYIYAVVRRLPEKERKDVSMELDGLISSMLADRANSSESEEEQVRAVLNELGNPEELARNYSNVAKNCLIGEPHFSLYKRVLKIVLIAVAGALALALLIEWLTGIPRGVRYDLGGIILLTTKGIAQLISTIISGLQGAFAIVTIIFAILYHQGVELDSEKFDLNDLPELPDSEKRTGIGEFIVSMVFLSIFAVLFVVLPHINIPGLVIDGKWASFFNPEVLVSIRPLLIALVGTALLELVVKMTKPMGSMMRFLATLLANGVVIITLLVWFGNPLVVNPEYVSMLKGTLGLNMWNVSDLVSEGITGLIGKWAMQPLPLMIALLIIIIVSIVEIVKTGIKTANMRKKSV